MKCREIMTEELTCCVPSDSVASVARVMKSENVGAVPVCDVPHSRRLVGIVTDRDLTVQVVGECRDANTTHVQEVMTKSPITCRADDDVETAVESMQRCQVRRILVVDENERLVGIIAQADLARRGRRPEKVAELVAEISEPATAHASGRRGGGF